MMKIQVLWHDSVKMGKYLTNTAENLMQHTAERASNLAPSVSAVFTSVHFKFNDVI